MKDTTLINITIRSVTKTYIAFYVTIKYDGITEDVSCGYNRKTKIPFCMNCRHVYNRLQPFYSLITGKLSEIKDKEAYYEDGKEIYNVNK